MIGRFGTQVSTYPQFDHRVPFSVHSLVFLDDFFKKLINIKPYKFLNVNYMCFSPDIYFTVNVILKAFYPAKTCNKVTMLDNTYRTNCIINLTKPIHGISIIFINLAEIFSVRASKCSTACKRMVPEKVDKSTSSLRSLHARFTFH